ncbi:MAG: hypothetical protein V1797_20050 [Pseudomonadota bacterium]
MKTDPLWTRCAHLSAGTCPQLVMQGQGLSGQGAPRPELNQDMALERLAEACCTCSLAPDPE